MSTRSRGATESSGASVFPWAWVFLALTGLGLHACKHSAGIEQDALPSTPLEAVPSTATTQPGGAAIGVQRRALLVGINDYQYDDEGIPDLKGTLNDVEAMRDVLTRRFGFAPSDIVILRDEQATKANIVGEFRRHLIDTATPETVDVFYASSHGSQMVDVSGDEPDDFDETLVTYDSGRTDHENRDLSDDELNALLRELNLKTSHVSVILDSCHSGTAVRAAGVAKVAKRDERGLAAQRAARGTSAAPPDGASGFRSRDMSYVLLSGAATDEFSYERVIEGHPMGALTWFLTRALWTATPQATYRDIMARVATDVTITFPSQHPQIEGLENDTELFGTIRRVPDPFFQVAVTGSSAAAQKVELEAGAIHGVTKGSRFAAYPPGTKTFVGVEPLASLEVTSVEGTRSDVKVLTGKSPPPAAARAVEIEHHFDAVSLRVQMPAAPRAPVFDQVAAALRAYAQVAVVGSGAAYDMALSADRDGKEVFLELGTADARVGTISVGEQAAEQVVRQLLPWAKWFSVWRLGNEASSALGATLSVTHGGTEIRAGKELTVSVRNDSPNRLYVSLFDLSFDGSITLVYPEPGGREFIEPGGTWSKPMVACVPGKRSDIRDVLKVFLTQKPHDLALIQQDATQRSLAKSVAPDRELEGLVASVALGIGTKGVGRPPTRVATDGWVTRQTTIVVHAVDGVPPCGN